MFPGFGVTGRAQAVGVKYPDGECPRLTVRIVV